MNAQRERGSDSENFGERITEFRVVVEKLGRFEVPEAFLQISRENQKIGFSGLFLDGKIHGLGPRGCGPWGDRSTVDRQPLLHMGAHRSSASGRSGA
jgi:hypothetical protein